MSITRRSALKSAVWSVPVLAVAVAAPAATASVVEVPTYPIRCEKLPNHGHGGDTANRWWVVTYSDGTSVQLDNGTVMSDQKLRALCKP